MSTRVLCISATGREKIVALTGRFGSDERACRVALATLPKSEGWRAVRVLP
jgi:hypothetical protein